MNNSLVIHDNNIRVNFFKNTVNKLIIINRNFNIFIGININFLSILKFFFVDSKMKYLEN